MSLKINSGLMLGVMTTKCIIPCLGLNCGNFVCSTYIYYIVISSWIFDALDWHNPCNLTAAVHICIIEYHMQLIIFLWPSIKCECLYCCACNECAEMQQYMEDKYILLMHAIKFKSFTKLFFLMNKSIFVWFYLFAIYVVYLIDWSRVTHICITKLCHHWFR